MRRFIIKAFFGPVRLFGMFIDRLAFWNLSGFLILAFLVLAEYNTLKYIWLALWLLFVSRFTFQWFDFWFYWKQKPVTWGELTDIQKYYYGSAYLAMFWKKRPKDLRDNWTEFLTLQEKYEK